MLKRYVCCVSVAALGVLPWMPVGVHAAEVNGSVNGAAVPGAEETAELEHGKINTLDASPVDPGHLEIESSYTSTFIQHSWDNDGHSHSREQARAQILGLAATIGVMADVDVAVSGSYLWLEDKQNDFDPADGVRGPESGHNLGDLNISGRYRFFASKEHSLEMAYIGGVTVPTGSSSSRNEIGTSQDFWSFNQALVATKDWGKWTANVDVGYALPFGDNRAQARGMFKADVAVGYQVLPWLQPEVELNYSHTLFAKADDQEVVATTVGLVMPINEHVRVNVGVQQGLWGRNTDKATSLYAALKWAF